MTTLIPKFDLKNGGSTPIGAVNRPINEKLSDFISVKDFGAVGDGVADDTSAIQASIDANQTATIFFPKGTYVVSSAILLTDASGHNFQGNLIGENATINFTNSGSANDTDANMQNGLQAYPVTNGAGGDTTGLRYSTIQGFIFNGPTHGASVRLANSFQITFQDNQTNNSRYGLVTECCINTKVLNNTFSTYTNAGYGMIMSNNTAYIWYGSATPASSYWNDSPLIQGNGFGTTATNQPLAHILDHGSQAENIRLIQNNFFISSGAVGGGQYGTEYGYVARNANPTFQRNWFENINYPIRILNTNANEGGGNLYGVLAAEPSGTYAISNFPDGYSTNGIFKGNYFSKSYQDLNVNGITQYCEIGENFTQAMSNNGTHLLTTNPTVVVDSGDSVTGVGTFTYKNMAYNTYCPLFNDWTAYTPTVSSSSGTITSYTVNTATYLLLKNRGLAVNIDITITNGGTGSGSLIVTLPSGFTAVSGILSGKEISVNGKSVQGVCSGTSLTATFYDNTYPGVTNYRIVLTGIYQSY